MKPIDYGVWTDEEKTVLREYINRVSYVDLARLLPGRTIEAIKRRATLLNVPRNGATGPVARRKLIDWYFSLDTLQVAYWAGFIAADGCVVRSDTKSVRRELRIGIHEKDRELLERFVSDIGYDGRIRKSGNICSVTICAADRLLSDLEEIYSIVPRKTSTLLPPRITGELALAYSIGYIDGDGCWAIKDRKTGSKMLVVVGTYSVLRWLQAVWRANGASIGDTNPSFTRNTYRLTINGRYAESVANLLSGVPVNRLERKWRVARGEAFGQERSLIEH